VSKRREWKEFYVTDFDEQRALDAAWQSSHNTFKPSAVLEITRGLVRTNLSIRDCRALFRFAGVRWRDYVTGTDDD
jgi:hypothetical protein